MICRALTVATYLPTNWLRRDWRFFMRWHPRSFVGVLSSFRLRHSVCIFGGTLSIARG